MDEKLIESVKKFSCIWDLSSEFYKCTETREAAWDQIIVETNISNVRTAKSRWKQLRDNYRDALKRQNATRSGQARKQRKEWKHQNAMSFLLPHMRDRSSNSAPLDDETHCIDESSLESSSNNLPFVNVYNDSTSSSPIPTKKRKNDDEILELLKKNQERREMLQRERMELKGMMSVKDEYDDMDAFFLNLAASTKKLPYYLQLRIKKACFNAVMAAEESNLEHCSTTPSTSQIRASRSIEMSAAEEVGSNKIIKTDYDC